MISFSDTMQKAVSLGLSNVWNLAALVKSMEGVPGSIVECGAWRCGGTIAMACADPHKSIFSFDTFGGMPEVGKFDLHETGDFPTTFEDAIKTTAPFTNIQLVPGEFRYTLPILSKQIPLSIVVLDCDLYESYLICMNHFWDMIVPGGIMVLEDYNVQDCPGATKAIDEFFGQDKLTHRFGFVVAEK